MNEGLLFVEGYIWWQGSVLGWAFFLTFFGALLLAFGVFFLLQIISKRKKKVQQQRQKKKNIRALTLLYPPNPDDPSFVQKARDVLRAYIAKIYFPTPVLSHTRYEVADYCDNATILALWQELENLFYSETPLSRSQKEKIATRLAHILFPS